MKVPHKPCYQLASVADRGAASLWVGPFAHTLPLEGGVRRGELPR